MKLFLWLALLPLLLTFAGLWGAKAADAWKAETAVRQAEQRLELKRDPPRLHGERLETALRGEEKRAALLVALARAGAGLGAASLGLGLFLLACLRQAEKEGARSREAMLDAYRRLLDRLPLLLPPLAALPAFAAAALLGFAGAAPPDLRGGGMSADARLLALGAGCFAFGVFALVSTLAFARRVRAVPLTTMTGRSVSPDEEPKLWALVRDLARTMRVRPPDCLVLGLEDAFFITPHDALLRDGTRLSGCTLYLGVPYMAYLSLPAFRAVVAHELAHYQGADLEYSLRLVPVMDRMRHLEHVVDKTASGGALGLGFLIRPALLLCERCITGFRRSLQRWSRSREFRADEVSAEIVGTQAAAEALVRVHLLTPWVEAALERVHSGAATESVMDALRGLIRQSPVPPAMPEPQTERADPLDSHPTLSRRLEHLGVRPDAAWLREAATLQETSLLRDLLL